MVVNVNLIPVLPAAQVLLTSLTVIVLDLFLKEHEKGILAWISLVGLAACGGITLILWGSQEGAFGDTLLLDNFSLFFTQLFIGAAALTILSSIDYLKEHRIPAGEYHALILLSTCGMIFMAASNDLILFFLGIETMSIAVYILTGIWREQSRASEAAMKYFVIGSFATGFLLYGIALLYGATGSTHLGQISAFLVEPATEWPLYLVGGVFLLLVGLAFKIGVVPFHFWIPDVYEGAPTPVTGFMAVAVKAAAFAAWARVLMDQLSPLDAEWVSPLWVITILTMTVGNLLAITQASVKRMLAYSSIAHAGYLLISVVAGGEIGGQALLFYLLSYTAMTVGAFAVLTALANPEKNQEEYKHFAGLGFKRPFLGVSMSLFMLSLAGFPPLAGFTGKFYIFRSAIESGYTWLAIMGVLNSLLSVVYYLRVIVMMYMEEGAFDGKGFKQSPYLYIAIALAVAGTVYLGILPAPALEWSRMAFVALF